MGAVPMGASCGGGSSSYSASGESHEMSALPVPSYDITVAPEKQENSHAIISCDVEPVKNHTTNVVVKLGSFEKPEMPPSPLKVLDVGRNKSNFFQVTLNCVSMLYGLGILSSPFAVAQAGWMGAIIALGIATAYGYGAYLMSKCARENMSKGGGTYEEVARAAMGRRAMGFITAIFYIEILGTLVGYCISIGDNLAYLFPHMPLSLPGLSGRNVMIFMAVMVMLPSVWLRDLSALSFTSMWCIASTFLLILAVLISAIFYDIGFHHHVPFIRLRGIPIAAGLYAFSFGGTSVFPSIYISMKDPSKFSTALVLSFVIATTSMVGLGVVGAYMFGEHIESQITLSMPLHLITSKIIIWMTILTPMFKFALQLSPITTAVEAYLYRNCKTSDHLLYVISTLMRSLVLACIAIFSMIFPYFEYIVAFVGSSMTISICLLLPCSFYLKIFWDRLRKRKINMIGALIALGFVLGVCGTIISIQGLINKRKSS